MTQFGKSESSIFGHNLKYFFFVLWTKFENPPHPPDTISSNFVSRAIDRKVCIRGARGEPILVRKTLELECTSTDFKKIILTQFEVWAIDL